MDVYTCIKKNTYVDSLAALFMTSVMQDCEGIETAYVGMAVPSTWEMLDDLHLMGTAIPEVETDSLVIAARAVSQQAFDAAIYQAEREKKADDRAKNYPTIGAAKVSHPRANICSIEVPGEYALQEVRQALELGMHCIVFSANVPLEQEREMKELAREKGLLCMGPDCGVANIDGVAFVLASINNRGPFGICGASGCGVQHVAAFLHACGTGVSQAIGTGGNDLKEQVGGITMLMGIDALEADPETRYIVLISRKPADGVLNKVLDRVSQCTKPVVALFMGADQKTVEASGAIWARDLDDCAQKALALIGKSIDFDSGEEIAAMAAQAVRGMRPEQRYVRGLS